MPDRLKAHRILIVEDEYWIAVELEDVLRAEGAEVIGPVNEAEHARSILAGQTCHAVVLDIRLADHDGYSVADDLIQKQIPFVFSTGYDPWLIPQRFKGVPLWRKPYEFELVIRDLLRILHAPLKT